MGLSLRKGYGLDNKSLSGDFASKMWSSYTQLNPGVYSEAVATEFKRRMKPDYVENFVPNGGGLNATDWIDTDADGLADLALFPTSTYASIYSIVTGSGGEGHAQRSVENNTAHKAYLFLPAAFLYAGITYTVTVTYRSNTLFTVGAQSALGPVLASSPSVFATESFSITPTGNGYVVISNWQSLVGGWIEVDSLTITHTISQNYFNTFGPSGLNKTTADWIGIMVTTNNTLAKTNAKTGAVMKWNMDGTILTQNNTPAYTNGANAGIITFTSTDGFDGVTLFRCDTCSLSHLSGLSGFINLSTLSVYGNLLTSLTTYTWDNLISFSCHVNQLTSLTTYAWTNLVTFYCYSNKLTSLVNFGTNSMAADNEQLNLYSTEMVNSRLAYYNSMFAVTPPIKNLTLNLSGATMGIPTGAGSNTDLLGILAKFTAAGFTATIIVRTS